MRSHVAVYHAPDNGNIHAGPFARYHQHQHLHWASTPPVPPPTSAAAAAAAAACYNQLQRQRLHHGPHAPWTPAQAQGQTPLPQAGSYGIGLSLPPVVNQQRINECAGIPLISNASSHLSPGQRQRLLRKTAPKTPPWPPTGLHSMSQLAAHAQGMPLLQQNGKQHLSQHHHPQQPQQHQHHHPTSWSGYQPMPPTSQSYKLADKCRALRYQNSAPPMLQSQEKQTQAGSATGGQDATPPPESCLPRIIKPRKRRKKDRKPGNGVLLKMEPDLQMKASVQGEDHPYHHHLLPLGGGGGLLQHDHTHGVCFCRDCDPLRSLWDYQTQTLRRSLSDASSSEPGGGSRESSSSTSSTHSSDSSCDSSICSQSLPPASDCAPTVQEESVEEFAPITVDSSRAEIVGVIGSQRSHQVGHAHEGVTATPSQCSLSDDSGYGDILSGINIANDLFGNIGFKGRASSSESSYSSACAQAETLLDESISEISRKLIETCSSSASSSSTSSGDRHGSVLGSGASDSGLDSAGSYSRDSGLVFSFEHLNLNLNLTDATPTSLDFLVDCNNNSSSSSNSKSSCDSNQKNNNSISMGNDKGGATSQQFYNNCFGLLWQQQQQQQQQGGGGHDDSQVAAAKPNQNQNQDRDNRRDTPTTRRLILGTLHGKLKPAFSTIS
ncbi:uncharacterized protein LOC111075732 [Drosophila obscura]|uniref:uncharacterized protein LOC111075732 n=1 Tax=Drosophila obscura TaxID=7282 RepID=UPI001BB13586|nr:uncharacterized protein LOC111075732 [Drosophila obscura]